MVSAVVNLWSGWLTDMVELLGQFEPRNDDGSSWICYVAY